MEEQIDINRQFKTFFDLFRYRASQQGSNTIYTYLSTQGEESLTFKQLEEEAKIIAAKLQTDNLQNEPVLLAYQQDMNFIKAFYGCIYAGVIAVPVQLPTNNKSSVDKINKICTNAGVKKILTTEKLQARLRGIGGSGKEIETLCTDIIDIKFSESWREPQLSTKSIMFLQYTSGSTGDPKGVVVDHNNILHNEESIKYSFGHDNETLIAGWLPFFHDMGLIGNLLQPAYLGVQAVLMSPMSFIQKPLRWLKAISDYKISTSGGPNFAYDLCVDKISDEELKQLDLSSWNVAFNGAEPIHVSTLERFYEKFKQCGFRYEAFYPTYGLAEATLLVSGVENNKGPTTIYANKASLANNDIKPTSDKNNSACFVSVGKTDSTHKVIIVDPDTKERCLDNKIGEIWFKGPSVPRGYWNSAKISAKTFNTICMSSGEIGYMRTGDLGFIRDGQLFITGRIKELIIVNGRNYYPQDIERSAQLSDDALVIGSGAEFSVESNKENSESKIILVQEIKRTHRNKIDLDTIANKIKQRVFSEHGLNLSEISLVKQKNIKKTSSGKVQRKINCQLYINGQHQEIHRHGH